MLLQEQLEVVAVIESQRFCHRVLDELNHVAKIDLLIPRSDRTFRYLGLFEEHYEVKAVGYVLFHRDERNPTVLLDSFHRPDFERSGLVGENPTLPLRVPDVDVV